MAAEPVSAPWQSLDSPVMHARTLKVVKFSDYAASNEHRDVSREMEMLRDFAASMHFDIEWVDVFRAGEALSSLVNGEADLSISAVPIDNVSDPRLLRTEAIAVQRYRVVGRTALDVDSPLGLGGLNLAVKLSSPLWAYLEQLRSVVPDIHLQVLPDDLSQEETLNLVGDGVYDAALLADETTASVLSNHPRVKFLFDVTGPEPVTWFARIDQAPLINSLNDFISRYHTAYHLPSAKPRSFNDIRRHRVLRVITRIDNDNSVLKGGRPQSFELELARRFADQHSLTLEVLIGQSEEEILTWLREGAGDVVTTRVDADTIHGEPAFRMSREYHHDATVLVTRDGFGFDPADSADLIFAGYEDSPEYLALQRYLGNCHGIVNIAPELDIQLVLDRVEAGELDGVVLNYEQYLTAHEGERQLSVVSSIPSTFRYRWTLRGADMELGDTIDQFLQSTYRNETYNVLKRRFVGRRSDSGIMFGDLSPFDELIRTYAEQYGFDWRLITAQMYQESQFDPQALSDAGAAGLMQIMPQTAAALGVGDPNDPESSIQAGVRYLDSLRERFNDRIPMHERTWFALAAYNIGYERVQRARRLAEREGLNPDRWFNHVETAMRQMTRGESLVGARCRCGQAIVYVREIRTLYDAYRSLEIASVTRPEMAAEQRRAERRGVAGGTG